MEEILFNFIKIYENIHKEFLVATKEEDFFGVYMFTLSLNDYLYFRDHVEFSIPEGSLDFMLDNFMNCKHFPTNIQNPNDGILEFGLDDYFSRNSLFDHYLYAIQISMGITEKGKAYQKLLERLHRLMENGISLANYANFIGLLDVLHLFEEKENLPIDKTFIRQIFTFLKIFNNLREYQQHYNNKSLIETSLSVLQTISSDEKNFSMLSKYLEDLYKLLENFDESFYTNITDIISNLNYTLCEEVEAFPKGMKISENLKNYNLNDLSNKVRNYIVDQISLYDWNSIYQSLNLISYKKDLLKKNRVTFYEGKKLFYNCLFLVCKII